jgi:hypothetical protein
MKLRESQKERIDGARDNVEAVLQEVTEGKTDATAALRNRLLVEAILALEIAAKL